MSRSILFKLTKALRDRGIEAKVETFKKLRNGVYQVTYWVEVGFELRRCSSFVSTKRIKEMQDELKITIRSFEWDVMGFSAVGVAENVTKGTSRYWSAWGNPSYPVVELLLTDKYRARNDRNKNKYFPLIEKEIASCLEARESQSSAIAS